MKTKHFLISAFLCTGTTCLLAQNQPKKAFYPSECIKNEISIDGKLDEPVWQKAN